MPSNIIELFGYDPNDVSEVAAEARRSQRCPFSAGACSKTLSDGIKSGVCTLSLGTGATVICCPVRLYAEDYKILSDVARTAFEVELPLVNSDSEVAGVERIVVFGKGRGRELRLPSRRRVGGYFVDWILARVSPANELVAFVAVEVQSIDTTGNYRAEREAYLSGATFSGRSTAGFNWENVNKRILPQLIYKGHVLRNEPLCTKGLFFVCPSPVKEKILERLGDDLIEYFPQSGALTIMWYDLGPRHDGEPRELRLGGSFSTTVDQVATAFTAPRNLPPARSYEAAIRAAMAP